jgi:hypoxanthine phosphoribosyltransferase
MSGLSNTGYPELAGDLSEILLTSEQIQNRVGELGKQISSDYEGRNPIVVGVLKGVLFFIADLLRAITIPVEVDFMAVASYSAEARDRGLVRLVKDLEMSITGRHVLFVEDVVDTGLTLNYLLRTLKMREPASLEVCTLFSKHKMRLIDMHLKYIGFELPDRFVVGYGLDHRERYRNLPFVGLLKPQVLRNKE